MGYLRSSLRSRAAHFVSDLTTVILNPISDDEPSYSPEEAGKRTPGNEEAEKDTVEPDGPDTSSFSAFLVSLLSSDSSGHPIEDIHEDQPGKGDTASGSGLKQNGGRKGLLARGKQTLGRAIHRVARVGGSKQSSEVKVDCDVINDSSLHKHELRPIKVPIENEILFDLPDISEPSLLLSENTRSALYFSLPALVKGRKWVLLYSTWRHGISLSTLYRRSMLLPGDSLLVVGDKKGAVFGGLVEAPLRPTNKKYQGTNSSFLFTDLPSHPVVFRPTGANHYYTLCATDYLALGGGGHFALYLDGDLLTGSSSASETFGNSCLAHTQDFEVKEVELWGFVYASKYDEIVKLCRTEQPGICRW